MTVEEFLEDLQSCPLTALVIVRSTNLRAYGLTVEQVRYAGGQVVIDLDHDTPCSITSSGRGRVSGRSVDRPQSAPRDHERPSIESGDECEPD